MSESKSLAGAASFPSSVELQETQESFVAAAVKLGAERTKTMLANADFMIRESRPTSDSKQLTTDVFNPKSEIQSQRRARADITAMNTNANTPNPVKKRVTRPKPAL